METVRQLGGLTTRRFVSYFPRCLLFIVLQFSIPALAQSSIFEPVTPRGIFGGISERARSVFEGVQEGVRGIFEGPSREEGGAIIPVIPILPTPAPSPPPLPDAGDFIKLTLEWEALSLGGENGVPPEKDPLEEEHKAQLTCPQEGCEQGCQVTNIHHSLVGWCGQKAKAIGPVPSGIPLEVEGPNSYTLSKAISNKYIRRDGYTFDCISIKEYEEEVEEPTEEPTAPVTPKPPTPISRGCSCRVCAGSCLMMNFSGSDCPCSDECGRDEDCRGPVPPQPPAPTSDPYDSFQASALRKSRIVCSTQNYQEFQTEIFHSNDIALCLNVENLSNHPVENILVEFRVLTYNPNDLQIGLPHNLDYPYKVASRDLRFTEYRHGHVVPSLERFENGEKFKNSPPFQLGPFVLKAGQTKKFALQPEKSLFCNVVEGEVFEIESQAKILEEPPCDCQTIMEHEIGPGGCQVIENPSSDQCRRFYEAGKTCGDPMHKGLECWCKGFAPVGCEGVEIPGKGKWGEPHPDDPACKEAGISFNFVKPAFACGCGKKCVAPPKPKIQLCGGIVPRDYNFVCDPNDPVPDSQCDLINANPNDERYRLYRDVTYRGGCGYEASSNNSIIGPIQFVASYGKDQISRSVLLVSLPIGGKIIDDEARPFGWPVRGEIMQNWGNTGQAQSEGYYRSDLFQPYGDYLYCPNEGSTYPHDGRPRAGDYLHPGIDIKPAEREVAPLQIYSTHAGWVTYAGPDLASPSGLSGRGWVVQVESDVNRDNIPDFATRYEHLLADSLTIGDVHFKNQTFKPLSTPIPFGQGSYVARNQLLGLMGDTGTPGISHLHYEILKGTFKSGDVNFKTCSNDPYLLACLGENLQSFFFGKLRFEPEIVQGAVYKNP